MATVKRLIHTNSAVNQLMKKSTLNNFLICHHGQQSLYKSSPFGYLSQSRFCIVTKQQKELQFDPLQPTTFTNRYNARDAEGKVKLMIGDYTTYSKTFSAADIQKYSKLTGNFNPLHDTIDDTVARRAGFEGTIIHGMFTTSIFSAAIGAHFPGAIVFEIYSRWSKPIYIGETLTGYVTIKKILAKAKLVVCDLVAKNQDDIACISGKVTLLIKNLDTEDLEKMRKKKREQSQETK
eukprot:CAMPEP_0201568664 /NCGR_PEP_ID=MMETSP0190_2-20130828/9884_1 /ASSEMBLY_ACC=CAM_ASM_000263 /TAXON_ID=37353 /ORGANISM="Rosalina sp." /LENGTH=235 /DNA_ID=CAMNT_0047990045 /DNA_START=17 /DNA_END=724 /DNA_ORIENTATION=+